MFKQIGSPPKLPLIVRSLALMAAALFTLPACSRDSNESVSPPTIPPQQPVRAGFQAITDAKSGFQMALPVGWRHFDLDDEPLDEIVKQLRNEEPTLAISADSQIRSLVTKHGTFYAADFLRASTSPIATNISIIRQGGELPFNPEQLMQTIESQSRNAGATDFVGKRTSLPVGRAVLITYIVKQKVHDNRTANLNTVQYWFSADQDTYVLTLTTDRPAEYRPAFDEVARSFRLLKR